MAEFLTMQEADELPTSLPVKGNCAYSVFEIQIPAAPAA